MGYLLGCLRGRERERPAAFISLGLLAVAVGPAIKKYLPKIMDVIKASLPTKVCFVALAVCGCIEILIYCMPFLLLFLYTIFNHLVQFILMFLCLYFSEIENRKRN